MKLVFLFLVALALVAAAPADPPVYQILRSDFDLDPVGAYKFGFETDNHIVRDEVGEIKTIKNEEGKDEQIIAVRGSYSYTDPEGNPITLTFVADENGFHPEGAHIPVAPQV